MRTPEARSLKLGRTLTAVAIVAGSLLGFTAPAAQAAPTNRTVVNAWYDDFLGRDADADPGSTYWVSQLDRQAPGDVLWTITHSREYVEREVAAYYNDLLGRAPDRGASYWVEGVLAGRFPLEWVRQNILASQEYYDDWYIKAFVVDDWYGDILGRFGASDGEAAYWLDRASRVGRLQAVREIYYSDEAVRYRINQHYRLMYRDADIAGINYWYGKEVESDINVQVLIAASPEYRVRREYF